MPFSRSANKLNKHASYVLHRDEFTIFLYAFASLFGSKHTSYPFPRHWESKDCEIRLLADNRRICAALGFYPPALAAYTGHLMAHWYDSTSFLAWAIILIYLVHRIPDPSPHDWGFCCSCCVYSHFSRLHATSSRKYCDSHLSQKLLAYRPFFRYFSGLCRIRCRVWVWTNVSD